jgi:hypothetical protein
MSKPVTFPSGLTLVEARELFSGVVVSVGVFDLSDDGKPGKMLFPPCDKVITNLTADRVILDGGTRGHTSINIASGASVPKAGTVTLIAPPQAARLRDLLGVAPGPMPSPPPPRRVETKAVKALVRDLTERNPIDDTRLTLPERVVMVPHGRHVTVEVVMDTLHDLRTDALAIYAAVLNTLSRVPSCSCGAVSTVCDMELKCYLCDACATPRSLGWPEPWAPLARAVARLTTLPAGVL